MEQLAPLLDDLRRIAALKERRTGVFYRRGAAALHFHEDSDGLYADLKQGREWIRYSVNAAEQRAALLDAVRTLL